MLNKIISFFYKKKFQNISGHITIEYPLYVWNKHVHIGKNVQLSRGVCFWGNGPIFIGDNVKIGFNTIIYASQGAGVTIEEKSIVAANCYIIDANHNISKGIPIQEQGLTAKEIFIGKDVWIGVGCVITKGSKIKNGAVIGANSFVNSNWSSFTCK